MLVRVAFRLPDGTELRYLEAAPGRGERVRATGGRTYFVSDVEPDDGASVVTCLPLVELSRETRRQASRCRRRAAANRARSLELAHAADEELRGLREAMESGYARGWFS